jgi:alkylation response protein AidB-like acyl-CoA dehydrogenase
MARRPSVLNQQQWEFAEQVRHHACDHLADPALGARDREGEFWDEGWRQCAAMNLCGLPVPTELGGAGADRRTTAASLEALGYGCSDAGLNFALNAHLWSAVIPIWQFGNDEQRDAYLGRLCRGEWIGLHAMTEPSSGSDAFSLATVAEPDDDGYVLRGRKTLITNAPLARLFVVFARSPGSDGPLGVSAFVVEAGTPGLTITEPTRKLGLRTALMADLVLDGVRVGRESILGTAGRGARVFIASMEWERLLIMAAQLGTLERSLEEAIAYAKRRRQFGRSISEFEAVSDKLVDAQVGMEAARAFLYETAWSYDNGETRPGRAAAVKLFAAETVLKAALDLVQVHGGLGFTEELAFERRLRDAVGARLYSGSSEMMRRLVARDMGL